MNTGKIGKFEVTFEDSVEFHQLKREIWGNHCYYMELEEEAPRILDIGSHIGMSVLYFKQLFSESTIEAYEPHPDSVKFLKDNLLWNNITGVNVHNIAISSGEPSLVLHTNTDNSWRSTISVFPNAWNESQETTPGDFPAIPFKQVLDSPFDLVKMDVEGYEFDLLKSVRDKLYLGKHWLIEIHGLGHYDIRELITLFEKVGYDIRLEKGGKPIKPHQLSGLALLHAFPAGSK